MTKAEMQAQLVAECGAALKLGRIDLFVLFIDAAKRMGLLK